MYFCMLTSCNTSTITHAAANTVCTDRIVKNTLQFDRIADTNLVLSLECLQSLSRIVITTNNIIRKTACAAIGFPSFTTVFAKATMRVQQ